MLFGARTALRISLLFAATEDAGFTSVFFFAEGVFGSFSATACSLLPLALTGTFCGSEEVSFR